MRYKLMIAVASAALMATSGVGMADQNHYLGNGHTSANGDIGPHVNAEHPVDKTNQGLPQGSPQTEEHAFSNGNDQAGMENGNTGMSRQPQDMAALIGRPVLNQKGRQIGNVVRATDDGLVITTGQYLGMGEHEVLLRSSHVRTSKVDGALMVTTDLSRDQISDLPTYKAQPSPNPDALYNVPENEGSGAAGRSGSGMSH